MPQICHDLPVRIYDGEFPAGGRHWRDGLQRAIEDLTTICDLVSRIVQQVGCEGLRLFVKPESIGVARAGDEFSVLDREPP